MEEEFDSNILLDKNTHEIFLAEIEKVERNKYLKDLLAKNAGAIIISGFSITLYYLSTQNQPMTVRFDSIGSNFVMNWWGGYISLDYLFPLEKNVEIITAPVGCDKAAAFKKLTAATVAIITSLPYGIAAYTFKTGSVPSRLVSAGMQLAGNVPLYLYSIAHLIENDLTKAYNFTSDLIRYTFCSDEEKQTARDIDLVRRVVMKQFSLIIEEIKRGDLNLDECNLTNIYDTETNPLEQLINNRPAFTPPTYSQYCPAPSFWQSGCGKFLSFMGFTAKSVINTLSANVVLFGAAGYQCATEQQFTDKPFNWGAPNAGVWSTLVMMPLYYLCLKAGWQVSDALGNTIGDFLQGKPIKPTIWKLVSGKLGALLQILLPFAAATLSYQSGYTSRELYEKQCPSSFQFRGAGDTVDYSTDIFNGIYTYYALSDGMLGLMRLIMNLQGEGADTRYLQLLTIAEATLDEIGKMSRASFLDYSRKHLLKKTSTNEGLDEDTRIKLLGKPSVKNYSDHKADIVEAYTINRSEGEGDYLVDHKLIDDGNAYDALERLTKPTKMNI